MNVGDVAELAGVTVRTLHHYDRIGLLSPSGRSAAGYRLYAPDDLDRLHQVLLYRELGFSLEDVEARFAAALAAGVPADSDQAMDIAEEHRQQISRNFYDCPPGMHAGLGRMYVEDERFTAHYEQLAPGLARYVSTAVQANAARQTA